MAKAAGLCTPFNRALLQTKLSEVCVSQGSFLRVKDYIVLLWLGMTWDSLQWVLVISLTKMMLRPTKRPAANRHLKTLLFTCSLIPSDLLAYFCHQQNSMDHINFSRIPHDQPQICVQRGNRRAKRKSSCKEKICAQGGNLHATRKSH